MSKLSPSKHFWETVRRIYLLIMYCSIINPTLFMLLSDMQANVFSFIDYQINVHTTKH